MMLRHSCSMRQTLGAKTGLRNWEIGTRGNVRKLTLSDGCCLNLCMKIWCILKAGDTWHKSVSRTEQSGRFVLIFFWTEHWSSLCFIWKHLETNVVGNSGVRGRDETVMWKCKPSDDRYLFGWILTICSYQRPKNLKTFFLAEIIASEDLFLF